MKGGQNKKGGLRVGGTKQKGGIRVGGTKQKWGSKKTRSSFWWGNMNNSDRIECLCIYGRMILKWMSKK